MPRVPSLACLSLRVRPAPARGGAKSRRPSGRFNAGFRLRITVVVGAMGCASTAFKSGDSLIIIVGQNVRAAAADGRAEATCKDAAAVLEKTKQAKPTSPPRTRRSARS